MAQRTFRFIFLLLFCSSSIPSSAQFQPRFGQSNLFIYKSKEDSLQMIAIEKMANDEQRHKPVRSKIIDSLMTVRFAIFERGVRKRIFLPERGFMVTDSITETTNLDAITRLCVYKKKEIPAVVWKCKNLQELELVHTTINTIPKSLNDLKSLIRLYIHHNRSSGRLKLEVNNTITQLSIRVESPAYLPASYKTFSGLKKLDLSENGLIAFPNGARKNRNLTELDLQRNQITLSNRIKKHKRLEVIALHENKIQYVPASIKNLPNLKKLTLNINRINKVNDAIGRLKHLEHLSFYKNELTAVPKGVYQLNELGQIDLFHNQIERLDEGFANWRKLHTLYLSHNKFTELPKNLDTLKNLTGLYVWDNRLGHLPECLSNMTGLLYLRVNQNYLKKFPAGMKNLQLLEEIDISHNYFESLPEEVYEYPNLKILAMVNNPWNEQTWKVIQEKAEALVKREVSVHLSEKD
jgi:Leucine-rich repeat (LRR) protein